MSAGKNVRNQVIEILGSEFPLSAKQIFNRVKKRGLSGTYHGMYDCVQEMVRTGVINKEGVEYHLNQKWIMNIKLFINNVENNYNPFKNEAYRHVDIHLTKDAKVLGFSSIESFYDFMNASRKELIDRNGENHNGVFWLADHLPGPLLFMGDRIKTIKKMNDNKIKHYIAIRGNKPVDKFVLNFYNSLGLDTVKIGVKDKIKHTIAIYDDVLMIWLPNIPMIDVNNYLDGIDNVEGMDLNGLIDIMQRKNGFHVLVVENKNLVDYYKKIIVDIVESKDT